MFLTSSSLPFRLTLSPFCAPSLTLSSFLHTSVGQLFVEPQSHTNRQPQLILIQSSSPSSSSSTAMPNVFLRLRDLGAQPALEGLQAWQAR